METLPVSLYGINVNLSALFEIKIRIRGNNSNKILKRRHIFLVTEAGAVFIRIIVERVVKLFKQQRSETKRIEKL